MKRFWLSFPLLAIIIPGIAQDFALEKLENSPRHHEWVQVEYEGSKVHCFVAYPEISEKAIVAIVIHENRGLTDWVRCFADQLAAAGYIAIAPDLLSGAAPGISKTSDFANSDDAMKAIYELDPEKVKNDLNAVQEYAQKLPSGNGKTVSIGFCWGGSQSFRFATNNNRLSAALVFYGGAPQSLNEIQDIVAPVYGFYAGNDERINAGIPSIEKMMSEQDKKYEYTIYESGGHGFMRQGDDPQGSEGNMKARDEAWKRMLAILKNI